MLNIVGQNKFLEQQTFLQRPIMPSDTTVEDLTIQVDPSTGSDTDMKVYQTQAQFTARGAFASYKGAVAALPRHIAHTVRLVHADGVYSSIGADYFGDLSGITFGSPSGYLFYDTTSGLVRSSGTTAMPVSSATNDSITLVTDPGLVANAYRGKWLRVISGAGITQYKAIRNHSGVTFNVAGRYSPAPDITSSVEIVEPSVTLNFAAPVDYVYPGVNGSGNHRGGAPAEDFSSPHLHLGMCVLFGPLSLVGTTSYFMLRYVSVAFHGTIINGCSVYIVGCHAELEMLIVDPGNTAYGILIGDSQVRGGTSESSWLIRNALYGITTTLEKPNILYLYKGSIDDCAQDALRLYGTSDVELYSQLRSSGNIGYGIHIVGEDAPPGWSCRVKITLSWALTYGGLVGALGEINLDGYVFTYADLNSEPSRCFVSDRCSWVKGV